MTTVDSIRLAFFQLTNYHQNNLGLSWSLWSGQRYHLQATATEWFGTKHTKKQCNHITCLRLSETTMAA